MTNDVLRRFFVGVDMISMFLVLGWVLVAVLLLLLLFGLMRISEGGF